MLFLEVVMNSLFSVGENDLCSMRIHQSIEFFQIGDILWKCCFRIGLQVVSLDLRKGPNIEVIAALIRP